MPFVAQNKTSYRYGLAAGFTLTALAIQFVILHGASIASMGVLYPMSFLSAWFFGFGPASLSIAIGAFGALVFFYEPRFQILGHEGQVYLRLLVFAGTSLCVARIIDRGRRAERKLASSLEAAARSENQLRLITHHIPAFVAYMDHQGRYQFVNRTYEEWFGLTTEQIRGKKRSEFAAPETTLLATPHEEKALAGIHVRYENALPGPGGKLKHLDVEYIPDRDEKTGQIRGAVVVGHDVTERKQAVQTAERAREELRGIFTQTPLPMCILSGPDLVFSFTNPAYVEFSGRDALHKPIREAFSIDEISYFLPILENVYRTGEPYLAREAPLRLVNADGSLREGFVDVGYYPHRDLKGTVSGILILIQEVTEQVLARKKVEKLAEDLREAVRARDTFLSIASHELRTPITGMKLQAQMMKRSLDKKDATVFSPERVSRMIEQSNQGLNRISRLVEDMLDISRIQSGKLQLQSEPTDFGNLAREVLERFEDQLQQAGIQTTIDAPTGIIVRLDRYRMEQVLTNLITNAIRYAPNESLRVEVYREGNHAILAFQDRGPGIAKADQERVFLRFERLNPGNHASGLGLGLYIVKEIVQAQGGSIRVESEPGQGSRFIVELECIHSL